MANSKIIIIKALLKKNENSPILNFVKSPKIRNSRKIEHTKITRSTVSFASNCTYVSNFYRIKVMGRCSETQLSKGKNLNFIM